VGKILSQSGISLADTYNVEGSIVGVENLETKDVNLIEDMGPRVFSERITQHITRITSTDISQSTAFDIAAQPFVDAPTRIYMVTLLADVPQRMSNCGLMLVDPNTVPALEIPLLGWDSAAVVVTGTADGEAPLRFSDLGAAAANITWMRTLVPFRPISLNRMGGTTGMPTLIFRGISNAFGAGTVEAIAYIHHARPALLDPPPGIPSSHGLPMPSW